VSEVQTWRPPRHVHIVIDPEMRHITLVPIETVFPPQASSAGLIAVS
jgi:hypothetical protein